VRGLNDCRCHEAYTVILRRIPVVGSESQETRRSVPPSRLKPETNQSSSDEAASEDDAPNPQRDGGIKDSSFSPGYFERYNALHRITTLIQ